MPYLQLGGILISRPYELHTYYTLLYNHIIIHLNFIGCSFRIVTAFKLRQNINKGARNYSRHLMSLIAPATGQQFYAIFMKVICNCGKTLRTFTYIYNHLYTSKQLKPAGRAEHSRTMQIMQNSTLLNYCELIRSSNSARKRGASRAFTSQGAT